MGRGGKRRRRRKEQLATVEKTDADNGGGHGNDKDNDRKNHQPCSSIPNKRPRLERHSNENSGNATLRIREQVARTYHGKHKDDVRLPEPISTLQYDTNNEDEDRNEAAPSPIFLYSRIWKYLSSSGKKKSNPSALSNPTLIQQHLWSMMMNEAFDNNFAINTIGIAPTGSGKTLAYGLPTIISQKSILILAPTRELVQQIAKVYKFLAKAYFKIMKKQQQQQSSHEHRITMIFGGTNDREQQRQELFRQTNDLKIVIATPGRLLDLLSSSPDKTFHPGWIVLDEADQLAKDGDLGPQCDEILTKMKVPASSSSSSSPPLRQHQQRLALLSATYPIKVHKTFEKWVGSEYVLVEVDSIASSSANNTTSHAQTNDKEGEENDSPATTSAVDDEEGGKIRSNTNSQNGTLLLSSRIPSNLVQILHVCSEHKKPKKLISTLQAIHKNHRKQQQHSKRPSQILGIIFFSRIEKLKYMSKLLDKEGITNAQLHSQLNTNQRQLNLRNFCCGKYPLLLATDVAARGIDIPAVKFVIQYDFPTNLQQYIHRCGRAGRRTLHGSSNNGVSGNNNEDRTMEEKDKATVYSFFTRNLKPMAADMVQLLEANNAWVDPNLRALVTTDDQKKNNKTISKNESRGDQNRSEKKKIAKEEHRKAAKLLSETKSDSGSSLENYDDEEDIDDDFKDLAPNRIVLKRATHVSDASESEDDESSEEE